MDSDDRCPRCGGELWLVRKVEAILRFATGDDGEETSDGETCVKYRFECDDCDYWEPTTEKADNDD